MNNTKNRIHDIENDLQAEYLKLFLKRLDELKRLRLTGRLVLDVQKGVINSIQDQGIIAGSTAINVYDSKII